MFTGSLRASRGGVALLFAVLAIAALPFADLQISGHDSWTTVRHMVGGLLRPDFSRIDDLLRALSLTIAFALVGVATGGLIGLVLAPFYHSRAVRSLCIGLRSVHELFWALVLMQVFGLSALTGILALALPYCGIFAKVFAEKLDEVDPRASQSLACATPPLSRLLYTRLPQALSSMWSYTLYRTECGLRSSAVLGFIGLPTLGFQLDAFFKLGDYRSAGAILLSYVIVIASLRLWLRLWLVPVFIVAALAYLATLRTPPMGDGALIRFLTEDIVPAPLRNGEGIAGLFDWLSALTVSEIVPGLLATVLVGQIAVLLTGIIAFALSGLVVPRVTGKIGRIVAHLFMTLMRSLPEYMLAYLFLQIFGPSMLPAILALALHNGAIIGHLLGQDGRDLCRTLRPDAPRGLVLWAYDLAPRLYADFIALCLYRWEIILRETAVMGMLGVMTLGFYIDSAIGELRIDRALVLLAATAGMTAAIDEISRRMRQSMRGVSVDKWSTHNRIGSRAHGKGRSHGDARAYTAPARNRRTP